MASSSRWTTVGFGLIGAATVAVAVLQLGLGLHADDRAIEAMVATLGYDDLWSSAFLDRFYRPILLTLAKLALDGAGTIGWPLRALDGALIGISVALIATGLGGDAGRGTRAVAALFILASPLTFVAVCPFVLGTGDLIVGVVLLLGVRTLVVRDEEVTRWRGAWLLIGVAVAVLSKESGLLVAAVVALELGRRRAWGWCLGSVAIAVGYVALRARLTEAHPFLFATGYFTTWYSLEQLPIVFGAEPARLYLYDVVANLAMALGYVTTNGQLRWDPALVLYVPVFGLMIGLAAKTLRRGGARRLASLVAVVLLNAVMGYAYVRPRVMFLAHVAIAAMLVYGEAVRAGATAGGPDDEVDPEDDDRGGRLVVLAAFGWTLVLVATLARLVRQIG